MKRKKIIDVKLKNITNDITGHQLGDLYFRISPKNWSKYNPLHWIYMMLPYQPVWVIEYSTLDENGKPLGYGIAKLYEHRLNDLKNMNDLIDFINKFEEPFLSSRHVRKENKKYE